MKKILCVVDVNRADERALALATEMAGAVKAHLVVVYPYRLIDHTHQGDLASLKKSIEQNAHARFAELIGKIGKAGDLSVEFYPEIGFATDRIRAYARKDQVDLVVVSQSITGSPSDLKGASLQTLITDANLPIVIVPAGVPSHPTVL